MFARLLCASKDPLLAGVQCIPLHAPAIQRLQVHHHTQRTVAHASYAYAVVSIRRLADLGTLLCCMAIHVQQRKILNMRAPFGSSRLPQCHVRFWFVACDSIYPRVKYYGNLGLEGTLRATRARSMHQKQWTGAWLRHHQRACLLSAVMLYPLAEKRRRQFNVACCSSLHSLVHMSALEIDTVHCFARMPSMFCKQSREKVLR